MDMIRNLVSKALLFRIPEEELPGVPELINTAVKCGWQGNLWHCYLADMLMKNENAFSLSCERRKAERDSLWNVALHDMELYSEMLDHHFSGSAWRLVENFVHDDPRVSKKLPQCALITDLANRLHKAETPEEMLEILAGTYERSGLGRFGLGRIFRIDSVNDKAQLFTVDAADQMHLSDLIGYEDQKKLLLENTLSFLAGNRANNVLLYGDAGTGKSTSIQAIADEYAPQGLRLIELYKHQFSAIPDLLAQIRKRNYRFIILLDDLSFEENEVEYKYLKAVMEGGAEAAPDNVLIYATSNRRHLIKETWKDRNDIEHDGDIHRSDTMEEKLSLADRFGLQIFYPAPSFEEYQTIVAGLAGRNEQLKELDPVELAKKAATWQVRHGSKSGRSARQFISSLEAGVKE